MSDFLEHSLQKNDRRVEESGLHEIHLVQEYVCVGQDKMAFGI